MWTFSLFTYLRMRSTPRSERSADEVARQAETTKTTKIASLCISLDFAYYRSSAFLYGYCRLGKRQLQPGAKFLDLCQLVRLHHSSFDFKNNKTNDWLPII